MTIKRIITQVIASLIFILCISSCNSDESDELGYTISTDVTVSGFSLKDDKKVLTNLSSVFFSIDLEKGLIYNADSLPKGTSIACLIPVISYPSEVSAAKITMTGGVHRTGEVNYLESPTDSIDFTGDVILTLVAQDGITSRDYRLKVNVHKMEPDSLWWDEMAVSTLPSRLQNPVSQKSVEFSGKVISLIKESDKSYTISSTDNPNTGKWVKHELSFPFEPQLRTFASSDKGFYILDAEGNLYESPDAVQWNTTGEKWSNIIGGYKDYALGLKSNSGVMMHTRYPLGSDFSETEADAEFPVKELSNFHTYTNKWIQEPIGLITGGVKASGELSNKTWGFDGEIWVSLSENSVPPMAGASLIPYFSFQQTSNLWVSSEYSVLILVGGRLADGTMNEKLYISYDNGVNWSEGSELLQLPDYIPGMMNADNVVVTSSMSGNFESKLWSDMPSKQLPGWFRVNYEINGYDVTWDCPYIYLIGGETKEGVLYNTIWKGVINRLTFVPLM